MPSLHWFLVAATMFCVFPFAGAQTYTYKLTSTPDSATVFLNDVEIGKTPMEAKFEWTKTQDGPFVFMFLKSGFEDAKYEITEKPKFKDNFKDIQLEKKHPKFPMDSNAVLVKFDKLMFEFPLGKQIGHNKTFYGGDITWEAYSRVGVGQFATKADDVLGTAGFRTPFIQGNELFSDQTKKPALPRFLVGAKLLDIWVELGPTMLIGIKAKNWCKIQWQVYDKVLNKVVLTTESRGEFDGKYTNPTELNVMMDLFQDAMENFLFDGQLFGLVQSAAGVGPVAPDPAEADPKK